MAAKKPKKRVTKARGRTARRTSRVKRSVAARASASVRAQPLIAVRDVISSSRWYCTLLGGVSLGGGSDHDDVYDRVYCGEQLVLQLHSWDDEEHPNLIDANAGPRGHGVLLWFELDAFDAAVTRARTLEAEVLEDVHVNPAARHWEIWLRDPDGYVVVLASRDGEAAG